MRFELATQYGGRIIVSPRKGFISARTLKKKAEAAGPIGNYAIIPGYWLAVRGGWNTGSVEQYGLPRRIMAGTYKAAARIAGISAD